MGQFSEVGGKLTLTATISGLEPSASGGWHIHSGFVCDNASHVGGHYDFGLPADPWCSSGAGCATTWTADANGVAHVTWTDEAHEFSLEGERPVAGRTVVVHLSAAHSGARAACGLITPTTAQFAHVARLGGDAADRGGECPAEGEPEGERRKRGKR